MDKMAQLAQEVKGLEKQLAVCTRCGVCQANCPLFAQTRKEFDVSRGKLALIQGLVDGLFEDAKGVQTRLNRCLLCGSCVKGCPSGVNALQIFIEARGIIARYLGLSFSEKLIFKKLLANPGSFNRLTRMAARFQGLFFRPDRNAQGTSCARIASPLLRHRHIVPLSSSSFQAGLQQTGRGAGMPAKGKKQVRVAFFVGCLIDKAFPHIAFQVMDLLHHFNAHVIVPENQGCCGIPALASGDTQTFVHLVKTHVDLFSAQECDYLVTACATCTSTIIKMWPALIDDKDLLEKVEAMAAKTVDINWLLVRRFGLAPKENDAGAQQFPVTCHDPCHLKKSLDIHEEPRMVIRAAGHPVKEMQQSDACCGMGGSFNLKHYELSKAIGLQKAQNIISTGCSAVATSCPACMLQLSDLLAGQGSDIRVCHPVELLSRSISSVSG
jgi:glycolate oxidase iron-sulfur subunit